MSPNLTRAGWRPQVYEWLQDLLQTAPSDSPAAVFDFDNTCILGDIGELFSHFLIDEMRYRYDLDEFWAQIHEEDGRADLREITEAALAIPRALRPTSAEYQRYQAEMGALYGRRLKRAGKRDCYEWAVRLHVGLRPQQIKAWTQEAIENELASDIAVERRLSATGEEVKISRGIRYLLEMGQLMHALEQAGFEVWVVSATNIWSVRVFAGYFGIPPERVLGNRVTIEDGLLTGQTQSPVLFREGKVAIIDQVIKKQPLLVAGDTITDFEMLCYAQEMALVIDCGNQTLRDSARERRWALQPQSELTAVTSPTWRVTP